MSSKLKTKWIKLDKMDQIGQNYFLTLSDSCVSKISINELGDN